MSKYDKKEIAQCHREYLQNRDLKSKNILIEYYQPFVTKIARVLSDKLGKKVSARELASLGNDGLFKAIDKYDPTKGIKFESYSGSRIKGSMIDGLRKEDRVPRSVRIASDQFERHKEKFQNECGYRVSDVEFAAAIGMNEEKYHKEFSKYTPSVCSSFDSCIMQESQDSMKYDSNSNLIDQNANQPQDQMKRVEFFKKLLTKGFSTIEKKIIYFYYYKDYTMDKIAREVDLSESRVSQIHKKVIDKLREKIKSNPEKFSDIFASLDK